jgi:hypothetical protein
MSTNKPAPTAKNNGNKPSATPPAVVANGAAPKADDAAKPAKKRNKVKRVSYMSPKDPSFFVRITAGLVEKHGAPKDPWGETMVARPAGAFGLTPEQKAERQKAKALEAAKLESMSPEEKASFLDEKRKVRQAKRTARKDRERDALIAQIKREIAEGKL